MISVTDDTTIGQALQAAIARYADNSLLAVPANPQRNYAPEGLELSYRDAGQHIAALARHYQAAGYGLGHRVGLLLESRPEHMLHKLALNTLGVCCVPINPDYRKREVNYLIDHSKVDLIVCLPSRLAAMHESLAETQHQPVTCPGEDCICVAALDAPLRYPGRVARLLQPLLRI